MFEVVGCCCLFGSYVNFHEPPAWVCSLVASCKLTPYWKRTLVAGCIGDFLIFGDDFHGKCLFVHSFNWHLSRKTKSDSGLVCFGDVILAFGDVEVLSKSAVWIGKMLRVGTKTAHWKSDFSHQTMESRVTTKFRKFQAWNMIDVPYTCWNVTLVFVSNLKQSDWNTCIISRIVWIYTS